MQRRVEMDVLLFMEIKIQINVNKFNKSIIDF